MYPRDIQECRKAILKVEVNIGKWIRVDQQGRSFATKWHEKGYDSFWVPSNCGLEEWCIYDPKRIKVIDIIEPKYLSISSQYCIHTNPAVPQILSMQLFSELYQCVYNVIYICVFCIVYNDPA